MTQYRNSNSSRRVRQWRTRLRRKDDMTHTKGPWRLCRGSMKWGDVGRALIVDAGQHTSDIAWIPQRFEDLPDMESVQRANANLIAAAPELLDACMQLVWATDNNDAEEAVNAINSARAAINKAKGTE